MKDKWKLVGLLGSWHWVGHQKAFRFYQRVNQHNERFFFADYRIGDLTSRFHKIGTFEDGLEASWKIANNMVLDMNEKQLSDL